MILKSSLKVSSERKADKFEANTNSKAKFKKIRGLNKVVREKAIFAPF